MPGRPVRASAPSAAIPLRPARRPGDAAFEPMLPALLRGVIFLCALATPFVAALLVR
jgi:hypothetical protein